MLYSAHVAECVKCKASIREGAAFCGACGEPQAAAALGPSVRLALDTAPLRHLAVGERGLARWRIENAGGLALAPVVLATKLSGDALPVAEAARLEPGQAAVLAVTVLPAVAGFHELSGELRVTDAAGGAARFTFSALHVLAGSTGARVQVVNIDQSAARVIDNSRSSFGAADTGGMVGEGEWKAVELVAVVAAPVAPVAPVAVIAAAAAPIVVVDFTVTTEKATYRAQSVLGSGDIATVYGAVASGEEVALKIADQAPDNDLLQHEVRVLGLLLAEEPVAADGDRGPAARSPRVHLVPPRDQFRTGDGRLGTVFARLDGLDLTAVRDRFRLRGAPGLPPPHVIWVLRRALAALGLAHKAGILHGNVDPAHILIRPRDHMLWLVDWCWAIVNPAQTGQGFKAQNEIYSPPEVRERGRPTPASDLYALGKCAIHLLGGDPETKALPAGVEIDPRIARLLRYLTVESQGGRAQDAWELYLQVERIRQQIWGDHVFLTLDL